MNGSEALASVPNHKAGVVGGGGRKVLDEGEKVDGSSPFRRSSMSDHGAR